MLGPESQGRLSVKCKTCISIPSPCQPAFLLRLICQGVAGAEVIQKASGTSGGGGEDAVPEQMSPVLTLSRSRWVLGERSPSYGRLNGLIVKFSHGAPGYDRRQNYTIIKGHWICIGIHYFVKRPGHTFAYYWPRCLKCLKCALPSLRSSCWVTLWRQESKQWTASSTKVIGIHRNILFVLCLYFK